jgi:hypothetical protein
MDWVHEVHPFERYMLLHGYPEVHEEMEPYGSPPSHTFNRRDIEAWVMTPIGPSLVHTDSFSVGVYSEVTLGNARSRLVEIGCSAIFLVTIGNCSGGTGYRVRNSHLNCGVCAVQATMEL